MTGFTLLPQALRLLRRELRNGLRSFGVFLGCLFLGVFAISAIGNFAAAVRAGILQDAGALLGGDLEIRQAHRPLTEPQLGFLATRGELSLTIEMRTMAGFSRQHKLVELKAVDRSYPLYGAIELDPPLPLPVALAPKDQLYGAVVEPTLLERFSLQVGDTLTLGRADYRITAVLQREPDRTLRAFTLGPRVIISQDGLRAGGLIRPGSLINHAVRLRLPQPARAADLKEELRERYPEAGWRVRTWKEAAPRVRFFLDRMETNLSLLGLCSLLVGGLGVSGAVRGYFGKKIEHIAVMKCLGAEKRLLFTTYFLQILLLGGISAGAGLLLGAGLPWLLQLLFARSLPFPLEPGFYPQIWWAALFFGLLTAALFSLRALGTACAAPPALLFRGYGPNHVQRPGRGIRLMIFIHAVLLLLLAVFNSPDRRLALWFIVGAALCLALFRLLSRFVVGMSLRLPRPARPALRLALANIQRPGAPAGSIIFSLGIGLTALVMIVQIQSNLNDMVSHSLPEKAPSFFFYDIQAEQLEGFARLVHNDPGAGDFSSSPTLRGRITAIAGVPAAKAQIDQEVRWALRGDRFLSYAARPPAHMDLAAGQWWPEDYQGPPLISLTEDLAAGFGIGIGDSLGINILGRTITAEIANLRRADWSTLELNFAVIFAPGVLEKAPHSHIAAIHLPRQNEAEFARQVTRLFPNVAVLSVREALGNVSHTLQRLGWTFKAIAAIVLSTGLLVLAGAVSADQHRRVRDAVIFKVCGATRADVLTAFAAEFALLGLTSAAVSLICGSLAAMAVISGPLNMPFSLHPVLLIIALLAGMLLVMSCGLFGTWKALRQKPAAYLRRE